MTTISDRVAQARMLAVRQAPALTLVPVLLILSQAAMGGTAAILAATAIAAAGAGFWWRGRLADRPAIRPASPREMVVAGLDVSVSRRRDADPGPAAVSIGIDGIDTLRDRLGPQGFAMLTARIRHRVVGALRAGDAVAVLPDGTVAAALAPGRRFDLETLCQIAGRLQAALDPPELIEGSCVRITVSIGLCATDQLPGATGGAALLDAAEAAMATARRAGVGSIRVYSDALREARSSRLQMIADLGAALDRGAVEAWFQPQICCETGAVSGFEALARWSHPQHGQIPPAQFLPLVVEAGLSARLTDTILVQALKAVRRWDRSGARIGQVSINLAEADLDDPTLADRILWQLDRFDLPPQRLGVEILESVVAKEGNDVGVASIARLAEAGCLVDLDDFGTGHAAIATLRRFAVHRVKIDRSFVHNVDRDPEQQRVVAAILSMAERLDLGTVAEGIETRAEHARLAELGCGHAQGFWLARPMPLEATLPWIARQIPAPPPTLDLRRRLP